MSVLLQKLGFAPPSIYLPYWFMYGLALFLQFLTLLIPSYKPFLSPFKVALAGTHHYYNCDKAKTELGYAPVVSLSEGIELTVTSFKPSLKADSMMINK